MSKNRQIAMKLRIKNNISYKQSVSILSTETNQEAHQYSKRMKTRNKAQSCGDF